MKTKILLRLYKTNELYISTLAVACQQNLSVACLGNYSSTTGYLTIISSVIIVQRSTACELRETELASLSFWYSITSIDSISLSSFPFWATVKCITGKVISIAMGFSLVMSSCKSGLQPVVCLLQYGEQNQIPFWRSRPYRSEQDYVSILRHPFLFVPWKSYFGANEIGLEQLRQR